MTIPEIYEEAARRMEESIKRLGTAHPDYQDRLRDIVNEITRELALERP